MKKVGEMTLDEIRGLKSGLRQRINMEIAKALDEFEKKHGIHAAIEVSTERHTSKMEFGVEIAHHYVVDTNVLIEGLDF